jgi:hypothetical protein
MGIVSRLVNKHQKKGGVCDGETECSKVVKDFRTWHYMGSDNSIMHQEERMENQSGWEGRDG